MRKPTKVRILAFAYACEPDKGSEPGAGWAWACLLARLGETWVVTRANNREAIERALPEVPESDRPQFTYLDLPSWLSFWKRGQRGVRLYYVLWMLSALRKARHLERETGFDLVWHLTLANAWLGSTASLIGPRFIYGPVGGGVRAPWRLISRLGIRGTVYEVGRGVARTMGRYLNPLARLAWRRADLILVQNPETARWFPVAHRKKTAIVPNAFYLHGSRSGPLKARRSAETRTAVYAGRLLPLKGLSIALDAIARLPGWRLVILGSGSDERRLRSIAGKLGVRDRVEFRGRVPREEVLRVLHDEADVFLFPSLHDEAGLAVAEALSSNLPVVCLDRGGPPVVAAWNGGQAHNLPWLEPLRSTLEELAGISALTFSSGEDVARKIPARVAELLAFSGLLQYGDASKKL